MNKTHPNEFPSLNSGPARGAKVEEPLANHQIRAAVPAVDSHMLISRRTLRERPFPSRWPVLTGCRMPPAATASVAAGNSDHGNRR